MRLSTFITAVGLSAVASALPQVVSNPGAAEAIPQDDIAALDILSSTDLGMGEEVKFKTCKNKGLYNIESITLLPNPPQVGSNLTIAVRGDLKQDTEEGAYMKFTIKKGIITVKKQRIPFCEGVNATCPVKAAQDVTFQLEKYVDDSIPTWKFKIRAEVKDKNDKAWGCADFPIEIKKAPKTS